MTQLQPARRRRLVALLRKQPTYPERLGLDLTRPRDWFPWFVAASLFAKPISAEVARRTAYLLFKEGVTTPEAIERCGWDGLVALLDLGGYVRYDFSTADKLLRIAAAFRGRRLETIGRSGGSADSVAEELRKVKGVGPKTVQIFFRELRGAWDLPVLLSEEARKAAAKLGLRLRDLPSSGWDRARVESALVGIYVEHCKRRAWRTCPVGEDCGCRPRESR
jgi:endonuclease III